MPLTLLNTNNLGNFSLVNQNNQGEFSIFNNGSIELTTTTTTTTTSTTTTTTTVPITTTTTSTTTTTTTSGIFTLYSNFEQYIVNGVRQATTYDLVRTNISTSRRIIVANTITVTGFKFVRIPPDNWSSIAGYTVTGTLSVVAGTGATIDGSASSKSFNTKSTVANPSVVAQRANNTSQYDIYDVRPVNNTTTILTPGQYTITLFGTGANMDIATLTTATFPINTSGTVYPSGSATHFAMQVF
jgi:hypothetical protein